MTTGSDGCSLQKSCAELAPAMIQSALGPSPLESNLRYLTNSIGSRMTGTEANERAVSWALSEFRSAGVSDVKTEAFILPVVWSEGATTAKVVSPDNFPLRLVSIGWSPPVVPSFGITAQLIDVGLGDDAGFAKAGTTASDSILLVHQDVLHSLGRLLDEYAREPAIIDRAVKAHAAAIFWMSSRRGTLLYRHTSTPGGGVLEKLPQAIVASDAAIETDNFDFLLQGVPTLLPNQDVANYLPNYHASSDTFDKVNITNLKKDSAIAAITAYALANAPERIGVRQSRPQIELLLKNTGLDEQMKLEGFGPAWENGSR